MDFVRDVWKRPAVFLLIIAVVTIAWLAGPYYTLTDDETYRTIVIHRRN